MNILFVIIVCIIAFILALGIYMVFSAPPPTTTKPKTTTTTTRLTTNARLTTTTTAIAKAVVPQPNPSWTSVMGYTDSFNQCRDLCMDFQQNKCNKDTAMQYCTLITSVDLDKNQRIDTSETGTAPSGTRNCETNVRCYDVIDNCPCSALSLNIGSCVNLFYQNYMKNGVTAQDALNKIIQDTSGNCPQTGFQG